MFGLSKIATRIFAALAILCLVAVVFQVRSCQQARQQRVQNKIDNAQDAATVGSAQDSIATQGNVSADAAASEQTTAQNREDIRNAKGADQGVDAGVRDAGFASLCKRPSFANSEAGRLRCASAPRVGGRRPGA